MRDERRYQEVQAAMRRKATKLAGCLHSGDAGCEECSPLVEAFLYFYDRGRRHERER